jgi:phosphoglycolate phosphatase
MDSSDKAQIERCVELYRERYSTIGLYENELYPGVHAALDRLRAAGVRCLIATSKSRPYTEIILDHFDLTQRIDGVYASEPDGTLERKDELLRHLLVHERIEARDAVMVGDRRHDIEGALANGIRAISVTYGYGSADELITAGAYLLCEDIDSVVDEVLRSQSTSQSEFNQANTQ